MQVLKLVFLILVITCSMAWAESTLILEGNLEDSHFIRMNRVEDRISFEICTYGDGCLTLGKESYSLCEMKSYTQEPLWVILMGGEVSYSLAGTTWGGFVKALIGKPSPGERKIRVTDLMVKEQARRTIVTYEAQRLQSSLQKIESKCPRD